MDAITRKEMFMDAAAKGDVSGLPVPVTREEMYLYIKASGDITGILEPITRREIFWHAMCIGDATGLPDPVTREEVFLLAAAEGDASGLPDPVTREELYLKAIAEGGGGDSGKEYGVEWDYSSPSPKLTRTGDAAGFADPVPATSLTGIGSSPFDSIMPWAGMRMCNIIDGEVAYWQGDPQFSETAYDTMVFIPEFWYKAEKDTGTRKWRWSISPTAREGYAKHPGSGRYISRFSVSGGASGVFSKANASPLIRTTVSEYRDYSHGKGASWWMIDLATWSAIQILYLVEYANFNSQACLGAGQNTGSIKAVGGTQGAAYHTLKRAGASNQYRWIENLFTNGFTWIDGVFAIDRVVYIGTKNGEFTDDATPLTNTGMVLPETGFISSYGFCVDFPWSFIPDVASGSGTTFVTDKVGSLEGTRGLAVGGSFSVTDDYGLFDFSADSTAAYRSAIRTSRLIYIP